MNWFYAEDMLSRLGLDPNRTYIPLAELCDALGLSQAKEERRVRGHSLLAQGCKRLPIDTDTGEMLMLCIKIELLPLWLTSVDSAQVSDSETRDRLDLFQRECASSLWQAFRPQGYDSGDVLLPSRPHQSQVEQAFVGTMAMATLARHQLLIERQLDAPYDDDEEQGGDPWAARTRVVDDPSAARLAQTARRVALTLAERTKRNEYFGVYSGLYRNFGISSYRRMPAGRLHEALEWLERWYGDMIGEPEPPPDI